MPILTLATTGVVTPPSTTGVFLPIPKIELSLDDPGVASPTWIDITAYVQEDGVTVTRGRNSELDQFQTGTATVVLNNNDGRFDPTYASGPYYPNLRPMNRIRISATWNAISYPVMIGYTNGWTPTYPGPLESRVELQITDGFSVLAIPQLNTPSPYSDDLSTNLLRNGSVEIDTTDYEVNAATIVTSTLNELFGSQSLKLTTTNVTNSHVRYDRDSNVTIIPGKSYTASVYVALAVAGSKSFTWHIDFYNGASLVNSVSQSVTLTSTNWVRLMVSGAAGALTDRASIVFGTNGTQGVFDVFTDGWQFEVLATNLSDLPEERSNLRLSRVLDTIGWPATDRLISTGASILLEQEQLSKVTALAELQLIEQSENGRLWIDKSGRVRFLSRWDMGLPPYSTTQAVFGQSGADLRYANVVPSYDSTFIHNEIRLTGTAPDAVEQVARDTTSVGHYYVRPLEETGLMVSDNELADAARYELDRYATVHLRFLTLELEGRADPANQWPAILGLELSDRIAVRYDPPGAPAAILQDCFIEGITHTWTRTNWLTTFQLSAYGIGYTVYPGGLNFFVLGDPSYGVVTSGIGVLVY